MPMTAKRRLSADQLRNQLRRGDPASGDRLTVDESSELRRRAFAQRSVVTTAARIRWAAITAVAVAVVATVALALGIRRLKPLQSVHAPEVTRPRVVDTHATSHGSGHEDGLATAPQYDSDGRRSNVNTPAPEPGTAAMQRVFVTTPGGTRIVWVLNPHFAL